MRTTARIEQKTRAFERHEMPSSRVSRPTRAMRFAMVLKRLEPAQSDDCFFLSPPKRSTGTRRRLGTPHTKIKQSSIKIGHHRRLARCDRRKRNARTYRGARLHRDGFADEGGLLDGSGSEHFCVYLCVFLLCGKFCTNHVSSSRKKIIQREKKKKVSGVKPMRKKGKKKVDCHPYPKPWCKP